MRSSTGKHYLALDHVRAFAALVVVTWHFIHGPLGFPVTFSGAPAVFPLAVFDEGHTGVAMFMVLSGYLFAKLLDGKGVRYAAFLWNRVLRLLPLLSLVLIINIWQRYAAHQDALAYAKSLWHGLYDKSLPNGGWSITVEFHFYLVMPLVIWLLTRSRSWALVLLAISIALRCVLHEIRGEIQTLSYWTLIGRFDQFVLGALAHYYSSWIRGHGGVVAAALIGFMVFFWYWDYMGGFILMPSYPSPSRWWIILPTLEGVTYGLLIAWYDGWCQPSGGWISRAVGMIGEASYSIYLLHFFFVFDAARYIHENIMAIDNFYYACLWAWLFFIAMAILAYFSYRYIERPFLKLRKPYLVNA